MCVFLVVGLLELVVSSWYAHYLSCIDVGPEVIVPQPLEAPCPLCVPEVRRVIMPALPCVGETVSVRDLDVDGVGLTSLTTDVDNVTLADTTPDIVTSAPAGVTVGPSTVAVTLGAALTEDSVVVTASRTITSARPMVSKHEITFLSFRAGGLRVLCDYN